MEFYVHCRKKNKIQKRSEVFLLHRRFLCGAMNVTISSCQLILTVDNLGPAKAGSHSANNQLCHNLSILTIETLLISIYESYVCIKNSVL
jgi:hypothetical protein